MTRRVDVNGIHLHVVEQGAGTPVLLLHGFTGSSATWKALMPEFARTFRTVAVDLIGHGQSDAPREAERYGMARCVEDLIALLDALQIDRTHLVGYSMGGRTALQLAAAAPDRILSLVLEGASPGIADPAEREARRRADAALALRIEEEGIEAFVNYWERLPLFASQVQLPPQVRETVRRNRLGNRPHGLAGSLRGMGTGSMEPLHHRLPQLPMPTLALAGELDEKYRQIARDMAAALPRGRAVVVPGAGHHVHLERPKAFSDLVLNFLNEHSPPSGTM